MINRRNFLLSAAGSITALELFSSIDKGFAKQLEKNLNKLENMSFDAGTENEDFWNWVHQCYTVSPNIINLNNGGVSPQPKIVQDAHIRFYQYCNEAPSYYMWRILDQGREALREKLATLCGVLPEELAINRNATEGLNSIIFGLNLKAGDEVVLSTFDYPNMMNAWKQREKRDKIKLVWITIPQPLEDEKAIVKLYEKAITSKTKIVHITHMINWTGNIVPCKAIADMAHAKGCEVIVDGAHSFGQLDYKIEDTGADYFATSLHKWMCAPFGSGLLYIKKEKIQNVWALLSAVDPDGPDMKKFENLGTRSFASEMAIGTAVDFHNLIGAKRKEARLRYLKNYWADKAIKLPNTKFYTSLKPEFSCAITTIGFEGWQAQQIEAKLFEKHKIHSVSMILEKVNGIRIAPNVYTKTQDLDVLVKGLTEISGMEPPAKTK
ncbi:MAG: aminotransferase class V-fold PLP-dependent enzyme [Bacteroidota bacterium]|nr:aminotransferase class V-fold PLP-dependent enzyme [Bacteroidota bacterium]MDP3143948.1 aminotransferase class V-fold PLP-dependent enzyme [Bacteroidota bacterium]MDP3557553.1 aminotransferase class V-fold PLP-dependent enzyme [Bacteroidota bacterium]